jgi:hypothetical protein
MAYIALLVALAFIEPVRPVSVHNGCFLWPNQSVQIRFAMTRFSFCWILKLVWLLFYG